MHVKPGSKPFPLPLGCHPPDAAKDEDDLFLIYFTAIDTVGIKFKNQTEQ